MAESHWRVKLHLKAREIRWDLSRPLPFLSASQDTVPHWRTFQIIIISGTFGQVHPSMLQYTLPTQRKCFRVSSWLLSSNILLSAPLRFLTSSVNSIMCIKMVPATTLSMIFAKWSTIHPKYFQLKVQIHSTTVTYLVRVLKKLFREDWILSWTFQTSTHRSCSIYSQTPFKLKLSPLSLRHIQMLISCPSCLVRSQN